MNCPLCKSTGSLFHPPLYMQCTHCKAIYRLELPDSTEEKERYEMHNNDVNDPNYQKFVSPITTYILEHFTPQHNGLDFGSGTGPVISKILMDNYFSVKQYDPYFANIPEVLQATYDYIACCEVIEHFHKPEKEFHLLKNLLKPGGALVCMTHLYDAVIPFKNWYYKNDPTHVFIYRKETMAYIAEKFGFKSFQIDNRRIVFQN